MMDLQNVEDSKWDFRFKNSLDHVFVQETTFLTKGSNWEKNTFGHISDILKISKMFVLLRVEKMGQNEDLWKSVDFLLTKTKTPSTSIKTWSFKLGQEFVTHVLLFTNSVEYGGKIQIYN